MSWLEVESGTYAGTGSAIHAEQGAVLTPSSDVITVTDSIHVVNAGNIATINGGVPNSIYLLKAAGTLTFTGATNISTTATYVPADTLIVFLYDGATFIDFTRAVSVADLPLGGSTVKAFGDSITLGFIGTVLDPSAAYAATVANGRRWTLTNTAVSGSALQDAGQMDLIYATSVAANDNFFILSGYNDMRADGTTANKVATYRDGIGAAAAWLAIPAAHKVLASSSSVAYSGVWSSTGNQGSYATSTNGNTATFTLYGSTIYIVSERVTVQTGVMSVTVDGVVLGTYNCFGNTASPSNRAYCPFLIRITNLSDAAHTVVLTKVSGDFIYLNWAAGVSGSLTSNGPNVYIGNCLRMDATGYAGGGASYNHGSDAAVALFNSIIRNTCRDFAVDGLNVVYVDASAYYNPATDVGSDHIHPNQAGHDNIAAAFLEAMQTTAQARDRARELLPLPNHRAKATHSVVQSLANNTLQAVTFDTNIADFGGVHSTATNPTRFTVPVGGGGTWHFVGCAVIAVSATGIRSLQVKKNGTTILGEQRVLTTALGFAECLNVSAVDVAAVDGDYYELIAYQNSGGALDIQSGEGSTSMTAMQVAR